MKSNMPSTPLKPILSKLFKLLLNREHSRQELTLKLRKMGYLDDAIETALDQAEKEGFINEARLVEHYIYAKSQRGYGPYRIEAALLEKGIDAALIRQFMPDNTFWKALATKVRIKRFGDEIPPSYSDQAKQMRFLQSRGFKTEQMKCALGNID